MEVKNAYYSVEWIGETIWGDCFNDRKRFEHESEALAFIVNELATDPCVSKAFYTTHKTIEFNHKN